MKHSKLILAIVVLQAVLTIVLFGFLFNYLVNPNSDFNRSLAANINSAAQNAGSLIKPIQGPQGPKGNDGQDGKDGQNGKDGANGTNGADGYNGSSVTADQIATAVATYLAANPPAQGPQGETGARGDSPTFRCDTESKELQYKYPSDEDWTSVGATCTPTEGNNNE